MTQILKIALVVEVIVCFAMPLYSLLWGLVILWGSLGGALAGSRTGTVDALTTLGGLLGVASLVAVLRYYISTTSRPLNWRLHSVLGLAGLLSLWTATGAGDIEFNLGYAIFVVAPTLCALHVAALSFAKFARTREKAE